MASRTMLSIFLTKAWSAILAPLVKVGHLRTTTEQVSVEVVFNHEIRGLSLLWLVLLGLQKRAQYPLVKEYTLIVTGSLI